MGNDIAKLVRRTEVQPAAHLPTTAVQQIVTAIGEMEADDISVEYTSSQDGHRSQSRFTLRAYRRGKQILGEERSSDE